MQGNEDDDYDSLPEKSFESVIIRSSEILRKIVVSDASTTRVKIILTRR